MSDDLMDRARRSFQAIPSPRPNRPSVERRAGAIRRRRALATGSVAAAIAVGLIVPLAALRTLHAGPRPTPGDTTSPTSSLPALDFQAADGWNVLTTDPAIADSAGWQAWAANVPFAPSDAPQEPYNFFPDGYPSETQKTLPPNGILLVAADIVQTRNALPSRPEFPVTDLPLTITQAPSTQFEGQPPDRAMAVVTATVNGRYVDVRVVFGTSQPDQGLIDEAQRELDRLVVAPVPTPTPRLDQFGIRMLLPDGWDGVLYRDAGSVPELIASTRPITDLYDGRSIWHDMGPSDVVLILAENDFSATHYEEVTSPVSIGDPCPSCEIMDDGSGPPPGHALYYRGFALNGREFDLYVEFGSTASADDVDVVNSVLATLEIDAPSTPMPPLPGPSPFPPGSPPAVHAELPPGWTESSDPVPNATNPRIVAAYGSWPFPTGGDCGPEPALASLPADGAFVWLAEYSDPENRGDFLAPPPQFHLDLQTTPARWTCAANASSRVELFRIAGRYFEIHIALGSAASPDTVTEVDSLVSSVNADP